MLSHDRYRFGPFGGAHGHILLAVSLICVIADAEPRGTSAANCFTGR